VRADREGRQIHNEIINMPVNGNGEKSLLFSAAPVLGPDNNVIAGVAVTQDISAVRRIEKEREAVITVSNALRKAVHSSEIIPTVLDQLCQLLKTDTAAIMLAQRYPYELRIEAAVGAWGNMIGDRLPGDSGLSGMVFQRGEPVLNLDPRMTTHLILPGFAHLDYLLCGLPLTAQGKAIGVLWIGRCQPFEAEEVRLASAVADIAANAIQRSSLFEQTLLHAEQMATITTLGKELAEILDPNQIYERLASSVQQILPDISAVYIALFDKTNQMIRAAYGVEDGHVVDVNLLESFPLAPAGKGVQSQVIRTRAPLITNDLPGAMHRFQVVGRRDKTTRSALCVPLQAKGELLGTCMVQSTIENRFGLEEQEMLSLIGNTAAIAMMNARLFSETRTRMQHLAALRTIDVAIRSGAESKVIYNVLLDQLMAQLKVDAASVLLYDPLQKTFNYVAGRGFRSHGITRTHLRIGEGLAGKVAMQQRTAHYGNLASEGPAFTRATLLASEGFHTYTASPLVAKGQVKGVLEVFCRHSFTPDDDWIEFFETLAGDLAIALENITLFEELQRSNEELTRAYDTTLEGWAHALELRDQETEGHSKRVVAITLKLAQMMGVREEDMVHVRRGALLHDIGKMGIPDKILKKTAPLEAEEWTEMRRHPLIAFDLLSPIGYLKPALDVPLYHHERWDGQGYPYQLAGRAIPLSARIFAVVDVWDALLSNRPYRQAWSREAAIQYVQEQAGAHFDPAVVAAFMDLVNRKEI
jgi:putative nucleotidyltransferase with HDIG domain